MADEFAFTDEQNELRSAVRRFCETNSDETTVRRLMESTPAFDPAAWARLGSELGVLGLGVPEEVGGSGGGIVDAAILVEELGAAVYCGPVVGTVMSAIPALVASPESSVRDELLGALVEGSRTATFVDGPATASRSGGDWLLSGDLGPVVDAADVDHVLVVAGGPDGDALFVVDTEGPGVARTRLATLDQTRPQARVVLDGAPARLIADVAGPIRDHVSRVGSVLLAAEQVGGAQHLLDLCVDYAGSRLQFGRPIGSFQAVKHRLADMLIDVEQARSAAYHGAWALQDGTDDPDVAASIAQAVCSDAYTSVARGAVQSHGGIGFTWEHSAHLYLKRAVTDAALLGSADEHRDRLAALVLDTAEPTPIDVAAG
ncbi:acyl-CoA dehydrogenase [Gordonia spumicola]|uniref:Acyl-CoA dehydrogenase n=1 Tax=Gordonia spumicola TaxID=589161 RepID=A0A7I9V9D9_9ACTN|nr:acyl-CoA dehydrogenase family protein [Gordonia spumicola]GEE01690.1 acyl-CoA dehydrogenase [Gordonia spumicola]